MDLIICFFYLVKVVSTWFSCNPIKPYIFYHVILLVIVKQYHLVPCGTLVSSRYQNEITHHKYRYMVKYQYPRQNNILIFGFVQVRRAFRNIRNTVPEIINVLILFLFSIVIFALLAYKLFQYRGLKYRGGFEEPYLSDFWDTFFDLYVLVTTANSPDVM